MHQDPFADLTDKVAQALEASAAFVVSGSRIDGGGALRGGPGEARGDAVAIALSGGRDSVALLHAVHATVTALALPLRVIGLHVHHGLQPQADAWAAFCAGLCRDLGIGHAVHRVTVTAAAGEGIEAAARRARYAALSVMCREQGAGRLMFAHHLDDQVETVLLRLFRGSGLHGLSGMPAMRRLGAGDPVVLVRPWLEVERAHIDAWCTRHALRWIEDPSNGDTRFARNALRAQLPALIDAFPSLRANVGRAASHLGQASRMLDAQAGRWLGDCLRPGRDAATLAELDLTVLRSLPGDDVDAVLRLWLRNLGTQPPSTSRLMEIRIQLIDHDGGEPAISHDGLVLRRFRDRILACRMPVIGETGQAPVLLTWSGEASIDIPGWQGVLHFERDDEGGVPEFVLRQPLRVALRAGGERIVLRQGGPSRPLKQACQEAGIPAWRRARMPLLWAGEQLVFAAGLGMHRRWAETPPAPRWRVEWREQGEVA